MLNPHCLLVIYLDYIKNMLKKSKIKQKWFLEDKKIKTKYINVLKIEYNKQMRYVILNASVYTKQKINLTWPNTCLMLLRHTGVADVKLAKETYCTRWG